MINFMCGPSAGHPQPYDIRFVEPFLFRYVYFTAGWSSTLKYNKAYTPSYDLADEMTGCRVIVKTAANFMVGSHVGTISPWSIGVK
jgi:hypothetical protein